MLAAALLAVAAACAQEDPAALLRAAVLLPAPEERRAAALELSRRDVPVERWVELCASFGTFDAPPPGRTVTRAELWTPAGLEETELVVDVPTSYDPRVPTPLLLQMHWTGGSGRQQSPALWRATAEALGMIVLAPSETGENVGYTFSDRERQSTLSALRWARLRFNVDENRIYASGISRGGHLAWDLALRNPDLFAGIAPMIGGPRIMVDRGENNIRYLENLVHLPIRDLQGAQDDPVLVHNLRLSFERLAAWKAPHAELIEFPELGHGYDFQAVDWPAFWSSCVRDPRPERVVRTFARPGEGRAFWLEVLEADDDVQEVFVPRVTKSAWDKLDRFERLVYVQKEVDERTARLEGELTRSRIKLAGRGVTAARLLLDEALLPPKQEVLVSFNRKTVRTKVERSAEVLLRDFVERFDRTFLPVLEVEL